MKKKSSGKTMSERTCLLCEKPFKGKTKLCPLCNKKRINAEGKKISIWTLIAIKELRPTQDPFELIKRSPFIVSDVYRMVPKKQRGEIRHERIIHYQSDRYKATPYRKTDKVPDYIKEFMKGDPSKVLVGIEGDKRNPLIYYLCARCNQEQCQSYLDLQIGRGHNCDSVKSSGEAIIERFLSEHNIEFVTQFKTLRCTNPRTDKVMPYDIQITMVPLIIEIQGRQHYCFTPYFHGTEENFKYSQFKDQFKKSYAERHGYHILYINYDQIKSGEYQKMILDKLEQLKKE